MVATIPFAWFCEQFYVLVVIGALGTCYDLFLVRFFPLLSEAAVVPKIAWVGPDQNIGRRTYANREAFEWLQANTGERATLAIEPDPEELQDTFLGLYANRRTLAWDSSCGTAFGGDLRDCGPILESSGRYFPESVRPKRLAILYRLT